MPAGSTDFGQGNGSVHASYFSCSRIPFVWPAPQANQTHSIFIAFTSRIERGLLGSVVHPATYATVFGNTATPNAQDTISCRYYGPAEPDASLRNRFVFYITDSANTSTIGMTPSLGGGGGGGGGNITLNVLSQPITTDFPVSVMLQLSRQYNGSGVQLGNITAYVLTAHSAPDGTTVTQQSTPVTLPTFTGVSTNCPFWAIGAADTSGTLVNGNYWPGLLSQFAVGDQLGARTVSDVEDYFDGRMFPQIPNVAAVGVSTTGFARRLGYLQSRIAAPSRPFTDVTDKLWDSPFFPVDYPPIVWNSPNAWQDGGTLTGIPVDHGFIKVLRWQPILRFAPRNLPRRIWVKCSAAASGQTITLNGQAIRYDVTQPSNAEFAFTTFSIPVGTGTFGTTNNQVLSFDTFGPSIPGGWSNQNWADLMITGITGEATGKGYLTSRQWTRTIGNDVSVPRYVVVTDSHSASGLLTTGTAASTTGNPSFILSIRQGADDYLHLRDPWQYGYRQYEGRTGQLIVVNASTLDTAALVAAGTVTTARNEILTQYPVLTSWVHAHNRYAGSENTGTIAATASAYLGALYGISAFNGIAVAILDPGRFGPQSEAGLGTARPPEFYDALRTAYRAWVLPSTSRRYVQHFEYDGDWDSGNSPYMRVRNNEANLRRYVRRLYLALFTQERGQMSSPLVEYVPARFVDATKRQFVLRLAPLLTGGNPPPNPLFVLHTPGARPYVEISEDGGATWLRPENPATINTNAFFSAALLADGTVLVGKQPSVPTASWAGLSPGQLRVRYGFGFPHLNREVPLGVSGSAAYQHIMSAAGALLQQSSLATGFAETGISVEPFNVVVAEPLVASAGGSRLLGATGAGR